MIDKGVYQAPPGLEALSSEAPGLVIEIENPDDVKINGESLLPPEEKKEDFFDNLAEHMDEQDLQRLASDILSDIKDDLQSRKDWEKMAVDGIRLLGLQYENRTDPWQGACGVFHPMLTEAIIRFQSDTIMETFPSAGPVKTKIVGKVTEDKEDAAERVEDDLNWQLTENMVEFRSEHEKMLWALPGTGAAFKKVYDCPILGRQTSVFVPAEDVIIPYGTSDLYTCERIAHRMRRTKADVERLQESGFWRDCAIGEPAIVAPTDIQKAKDKEMGLSALLDKRHTIYEVAVDLDLAGYQETDEAGEPTGRLLPYIVTVVDNTNIVLSVRRNWKETDGACARRLHFVQYTYIPGFGAYGFGLFHLLGGFATSATSIMRQLVDAGTLANLPGGLKSKGLRIKGDDQPVSPGEFRDVDVGSGTIRDNILPLPYKEPSATLYQLLLNMVEEARRFAATADIKSADMSNQAPVGTTLAILERQLRTMTAVQARVHFSLKQELQLIAEIIRDNTDDAYAYDVDAPEGSKAKRADYSYVSIIPVSDPNAATMSQRVVQYQAVVQLAQMAPDIYDQPELHRQMLHVLGIKNVGKLVPTEDDIKVVDPVQENQNILAGKPVKAFNWQDHEAHIQVHMAAMQDPLIQQLVGQSPKAQAVMGAMTAHISEHVGFAYRVKIQRAMGMVLPVLDKDDSLPQETELRLSKMMAMAAPQVLDESKRIVAQQQAQKNAQDPVLVAQQMEQQNAREEIARKSRKDEADTHLAATKLMMEAKEKGVDPQSLQIDAAIKVQMAQADAARKDRQQQHSEERDAAQMALQAQSAEQKARADEERAVLERAAAHQRMLHAEQKHKQDMKLKAEAARGKPKEEK